MTTGQRPQDDGWQDVETQWQRSTTPPIRRFDPMTGKPLTASTSQSASEGNSSSSTSQSRRGLSLGAVAGFTVVILAAVVGFGLVWFFNQSKQTPPSQASNTVNQAPQQQSSAPEQTSSSSPTSSDVTEDFPASATTECTNGGALSSDNIRVDGVISCAMANAVASQVDRRVASDANLSSFTLDQTSPVTGHPYHLRCSRQNHLTQCSTESTLKDHPGLLYFYIKG